LIILVADFLGSLGLSRHYAKLIRQIIRPNNPSSSLSLNIQILHNIKCL
jgi:hypothetical protein